MKKQEATFRKEVAVFRVATFLNEALQEISQEFNLDCQSGLPNKISIKNRSSHQRCSLRKGVLGQKFHKIHRKHLCRVSLFDKLVGLRPATLLTKRLWHRCFPVNFAKFLNYLFREYLRTTASKGIMGFDYLNIRIYFFF